MSGFLDTAAKTSLTHSLIIDTRCINFYRTKSRSAKRDEQCTCACSVIIKIALMTMKYYTLLNGPAPFRRTKSRLSMSELISIEEVIKDTGFRYRASNSPLFYHLGDKMCDIGYC